MHRLFPSFGRSKNNRSRGQYLPQRYDNDNYYYQHEQPLPPTAPSWTGVIPNRQASATGHWEEEFVEPPSMSVGYAAPGNGYVRGHGRATVEDYQPTPPSLSDTLTDETNDGLEENHTPPPIVQREASFSRLQEAFADRSDPRIHHSTPRRPVTDIPLPTEGHSYRTDIHSPTELHGAYAPNHPVMVNNTGIESVRPEYGHVEYGHVGDREVIPSKHYRDDSHSHRSRRHEPAMRVYPEHYARSSSSSSDSYSEEEYPPYVLVVAPGHKGKKDTYYVVPGGAPVIFQDEHGNELTRVGDFSGRYRPRPPRPVIVQDEQGRELYRMGFEESDSEAEELYYPSRHRRHRHDDSRSHRGREREVYDDGRSHHSSRRHHDRDPYDDRYDDRHDDRYDDHRSHHSVPRSRTPPKVVYVDPISKGHVSIEPQGWSSHRDGSRHRSPQMSPPRHHDRGRHYGSSAAPPVINLDEVRHVHGGAGSPASRSYHSSSSHSSRR